MTARPTRIAQTSLQVKREYKKNGPRLPERQQRQLERAAELEQRATRAREQEERKRIAKKKREEKERREKEARRQLGVGLATQMVGYSLTQAKLKTGMEGFLGLKRKREEEVRRDAEIQKQLEAIVEAIDKEPWDDVDMDDLALDQLPDLPVISGNSLIDDELDDNTLLAAHDSIMPGAMGGTPYIASPPEADIPAATPTPVKSVASREDADFIRLHGPVNKAIETALERLPDPLIELLSIDSSTDQPRWKPPLHLLHKLNPMGFPPHRLRIKVGCVVSLLRDLNISSQLSKSSHLRVLRVEKERVECLVLDGQLEGTKTVITRVPFSAKHRNEDESPFQRIQFPIRVSTNSPFSESARDTSQSSFKPPSMDGKLQRPMMELKKPTMPIPKLKPSSNPNPSFRLPGVPASKLKKPFVISETSSSNLPLLLDSWDDFLDSGTQIARELCSDDAIMQSKPVPSITSSSTEDLDFGLEDWDDVMLSQSCPPTGAAKIITSLDHQGRQNSASIGSPMPDQAPKVCPALAIPNPSSISMPPPKLPPQQRVQKRKAPVEALLKPTEKKSGAHTGRSPASPTLGAPVTSLVSFSDFGLSTQEVVSFFDDDDFSSPPITV